MRIDFGCILGLHGCKEVMSCIDINKSVMHWFAGIIVSDQMN